MGVIGMAMSIAFRLQLAYPDTGFPILEWFFGSKWAPDGKLDAGYYMALVTLHGTIMVFYVLTAGLSGTFANLLIPLQVGARDMASPFMNMLSYWFFFLSSVVIIIFTFCRNRTSIRWLDNISSILVHFQRQCQASGLQV